MTIHEILPLETPSVHATRNLPAALQLSKMAMLNLMNLRASEAIFCLAGGGQDTKQIPSSIHLSSSISPHPSSSIINNINQIESQMQ